MTIVTQKDKRDYYSEQDKPKQLETETMKYKEQLYELYLDFGDNIGTQTIYSSARLEDCERRKAKMIKFGVDKYYTKEWQGLPEDVQSINIDSWTMTLDNREVTKIKD